MGYMMRTSTACLFGKWNYEDVLVNDFSLEDYIAVQANSAQYVPHSATRFSTKRFSRSHCPIVERLVNSLMMNGRNSGKKILASRIVEHAFEIIFLLTNQN